MAITASLLTNETLVVQFDNESPQSTRNDNPKWTEIVEAFRRADEDRLRVLLSLKAVVEEYSVGNLSINATGVLYRGSPLHTLDAERVMAYLRDGLPYRPIANYIARKMKNPSSRAIEEMYAFLEHRHMPLMHDGRFIAYKGVQENWYSVQGNKNTVVIQGTVNEQGQILNTVGAVIEVERSSVDDDFRRGCSHGLHAGSLQYAVGWGRRVLYVAIDPADVVSIPEDCAWQKLRCCKYEIIGEYTGPLPDHFTSEFDSEEDGDTCHNCGADEGTCDCEEDKCICGRTDCPDCGCDCSKYQGMSQEGSWIYDCAESSEQQEQQTQTQNETVAEEAAQAEPSDVAKRVIKIYEEQFGVTPTLDQTGADLGIDSIDAVALAMALEEEFGFEIPDEEEEKHEHSTVGQIVMAIEGRLSNKPVNIHDPKGDPYAHGLGVGRADKRNGTPPVYRTGDETGADSDQHRAYILGYVAGYAGK